MTLYNIIRYDYLVGGAITILKKMKVNGKGYFFTFQILRGTALGLSLQCTPAGTFVQAQPW